MLAFATIGLAQETDGIACEMNVRGVGQDQCKPSVEYMTVIMSNNLRDGIVSCSISLRQLFSKIDNAELSIRDMDEAVVARMAMPVGITEKTKYLDAHRVIEFKRGADCLKKSRLIIDVRKGNERYRHVVCSANPTSTTAG